MKKDLFNNKIKPQFISDIVLTIIIVTSLFIGLGVFFTLIGLGKIDNELTNTTLAITFILGIVCLLMGTAYLVLSLIVIRKYPKYKRLIRLVLNSDYYFVGVEERNYYGRKRDAYIFEVATLIGDNYKRVDKSLYPKRYWFYIGFFVVCMALLWANIFIVYILMKNEVVYEYYEKIIGGIFIVVEIFIIMLMFFFAFSIKKIRQDLIENIYIGKIGDKYERQPK